MRRCTKCKQNKAAEDFNKKRSECKECQKEYLKAWYQQNREKRKEYLKQNRERIKAYYQQNREKRKEYLKAYYEQNRERIKAYREQNRDKRRIYKRNKRKTDINFKLTENLRKRLRKVLNGKSKSKKTMDLIGCSADFLKKHLENQFQPGMSWENYGFYGWHVDHIVPCASFDDLDDPKQQQKCFHYTNLQPLWAKDNISKGAQLNWQK
jgi:hypothetical protein